MLTVQPNLFETKIEKHRYLVFRDKSSRQYLCVVSARSAPDALRIARQQFSLGREPFAIRENRL
jgi:hypothetical protein